MQNPKIILSLFDFSGAMLQPWKTAGYDCYIVDIQHPSHRPTTKNGIECLHADLSQAWLPPFSPDDIAFVSAFPPCDHLSVSGARWFKGKGLRKLASSISMFATAVEICEWSKAPYLIENPISTISSYWRKPDHIFHPYHFANHEPNDNYTKKTCLWTGGGFIMPEKCSGIGLGKPDDRIHKAPPGKDRNAFRSQTPFGFAQAVFEVNQK